jgi:hypothetical protein
MSDSADDPDCHAVSVFSEIFDGTADDDVIWSEFVPTSNISQYLKQCLWGPQMLWVSRSTVCVLNI